MKVAFVLALATVVGAAPTAFAQAPAAAPTKPVVAKVRSTQAPRKENLKPLAKISKDSARAIAMAHVAKGSRVKSSELEREKGTIVYSFDIREPHKTGVEEILVSAIDGSVVSQTHETPAQEKAEAKKDT